MGCTMSWLIFQLLLCAPLTFSLIIGGDDSDTVSSNIVYLHQLLSEERIMRSSLETKIQQMEQRIEKLETNMSTMQKVPSRDPTVAFHAYLVKEVDAVQSAHVVFDTVLLNIGNAYSPLHGIFRAPYNGTYLFSMTAVISPGHYINFFLKKNDKTEEFVFADSRDWDQASKTTILALNVNDYVWVEANGYLFGSWPDDNFGHIHMHSSFSGFLIKEILRKFPATTEGGNKTFMMKLNVYKRCIKLGDYNIPRIRTTLWTNIKKKIRDNIWRKYEEKHVQGKEDAEDVLVF